MTIETYTFIEVNNVPNEWAVLLERCTPEMKPDFPLFINVANQIGEDFYVIDNTLCNLQPTKTIEGVTGGCSADWKEVGFWRIKYKSN